MTNSSRSQQVTVDLDGVLVIEHSDTEDAAATWKKTYGHHPLMGFVDHGPGGTGEPVAALLRPGNAGSNTAADHITAARMALAQLPKHYRRGRHPRLPVLARQARTMAVLLGRHDGHRGDPRARAEGPRLGLEAAVETNGEVRDGGAEFTGKLLDGWPGGMRLVVRDERPHPGVQLTIADTDGMRITCFATNTTGR